MSIADALSSRYLTFTALRDAGVSAGNACLVVDLIHGREVNTDDVIGTPREWEPLQGEDVPLGLADEFLPFEPDPADEADYREWYMEIDRRWWDERIERGHPVEFPNPYVSDRDIITTQGGCG